MTIANGSLVDSADISTLTSASLATLSADNALAPGAILFNLHFPNLQGSGGALPTPLTRRRAIIVAPCNMLVEAVAVQAVDQTAASTVTVTITANGALENWPITITGTAGAGITLLSRLLYDNTRTKVKNAFSTTARATRLINQGSTATITAATTSVATPSAVQVLLVCRAFHQRQ